MRVFLKCLGSFFLIGFFYSSAFSSVSVSVDTSRKNSASNLSVGVDRKSSKSKRGKRRRFTSPEAIEQIKADCVTKYMKALDMECHNAEKVQKGGVYVDCSQKSTVELYDIMDMRLAYIVGNDNFASDKQKCDKFKGDAVSQWLAGRQIIEKGAIKGSSECILASDKYAAAKRCYARAIAHDGGFDLKSVMREECGKYPDVADKFTKAGDLGFSNMAKVMENYSTLQFTRKSENWREAVEAIYRYYMDDARQKCGEETYKPIVGNRYAADKRENVLTDFNKSYAESVASNIGRRSPAGINPIVPPTSVASTYINHTQVSFVNNPLATATGMVVGTSLAAGAVPGVGLSASNTLKEAVSSGGTSLPDMRGVALDNVGKVYIIDRVSNASVVNTRLKNIIKTGKFEAQDNIDTSIVIALGARLDNKDNSLYETISNLKNGDLFIIKQDNGSCLISSFTEEGTLSKISGLDARETKSITSYISDCSNFF